MRKEEFTKSALKILAGVTAREAKKNASACLTGCVGIFHQPKRPVQKEKL